ncbi:hypothetical protein [Streptococcus sp.]|uniref:hypothetical protein n=1 Tax=Streptococcus sp. TaxID=1306 RepID=UPI0035A1BCE4
MSYVAFIIIPSRIFKSQQRLDEYQSFFEAELTNLALQRDIAMCIKSIAARIQMVEKTRQRLKKPWQTIKMAICQVYFFTG